MQKSLGPQHARTATGLTVLGTTHQLRGDWAEASRCYREALQIRVARGRDFLGATSEAESLVYVQQLQDVRDSLFGLYRTCQQLPQEELAAQLRSVPQIDALEVYRAVWQTKALASRAAAFRRVAPRASSAAQELWRQLGDVRRQLAELAGREPGDDAQADRQRGEELSAWKGHYERELL